MKKLNGQAILFDKGGTLIDFEAMWGGWVLHLAEQLYRLTGLAVRAPLCLAMGYDETRNKVLADGKLAASPMWLLYRLTIEVMQEFELSMKEAELAVAQAWSVPDPVALAKPFTDLRTLFQRLHRIGIKIAIVTSDDRAPTQALIKAFELEEYLSGMVCADDGIEAKPAPDMVWKVYERLHLPAAQVMLVADTTADLKMGRAAGVGCVVGTLSGVSDAADLLPFADTLIDSIDMLHAYIDRLENKNAGYKPRMLNLDPAI